MTQKNHDCEYCIEFSINISDAVVIFFALNLKGIIVDMDEDKLIIKIIASVCIAVFGAVLFLIVGVFGAVDCNKIDAHDTELQEKYEVLDRQSYHYDADNVFLYIDAEKGIGGLYYGTTCLAHFEIEKDVRFDKRVFDTPTLVENYQHNWWREDSRLEVNPYD